MTPISKSGDTSEASNYRPISLLSLISKILERCFHNSVIDFLLEHNLLSDCQYGFRPKSSTLDALLTITRDWHQSLSTGRQVAAVFFDIKKAFDSVPHSNLLQALANIGITGELHQWFANYLTGRYQCGPGRFLLQLSTCHFWCTSRLYSRPTSVHHFHEFHLEASTLTRSQTCLVCR